MFILIIVLMYSSSVMSAMHTESNTKSFSEILFDQQVNTLPKEILLTVRYPKIITQDEKIQHIIYVTAITTRQSPWRYILQKQNSPQWSPHTCVFAFHKTDHEKNFARLFRQEKAACNWVNKQLFPSDDCCCSVS